MMSGLDDVWYGAFVFDSATKQASKSLKRGLTPLLVAQFMGAANDNILKTLLSFAVVSGIWAGQLGEGGQGLIALCLFIPFILFSGWAGPIADRHSKKTIALWMKVVELPLALAAGIGFATSNLWLTILAMVLLATQSAFFSPAKYGMIPEIVKADHVTRANGILNMATNIAVITGMLIAGFVSDGISNSQSGMNLWIPGFALFSVAIVGVIAISFLPTLKPLSPSTKIVINPLRTYFETAKWAWGSPVVTGAIAWSVFYFIATLALLVVTELGVILNVSHTEVSYILATLAIAVGCGSLVAGFISKNKIRVDISRLAAIFMGVILCMAGLIPPTYIWMMICMFGLGFTAGLYAIPLQSMMQILPQPNHRGRVLASCNALSFLFMGIASLLYWITRPLFGDHPQWIFVACGFTAFFAWYLCRKIPNILVKPTL
jgi:acyl-[acyl-carrier-protein]-phospholipid O-acyltransferase/long-chain-fatty-acid--[acyl-carrier-protein] ligase